MYTKVLEIKRLSDFAKKVHNVFGSVRHSPSAMFKKYSCLHNNGIGFIKPSECWMAGEHIALLRLLRLKNTLRAINTSKKFINLHVFHSVMAVLMNPDFWQWLCVMCHALYAPMQVLCLADQKLPPLDKFYYHVLQTNQMLPKYIGDSEFCGGSLLTKSTLVAMDTHSAGISDNKEDESKENNDFEEIDEESGNGDEESINSDPGNNLNDEQ